MPPRVESYKALTRSIVVESDSRWRWGSARPTTWRRVLRPLVILSLHLGVSSLAAEPMWSDGQVTTTAQYFQQALLPGQPGAVTRVEPAFPLTVSGFARFGAVDLPGAPDALSGELSLWGSVGPRDGRNADADVTQAWLQYQRSQFRLKLGRQVTLPGSSRYLRFDGLSAGVSAGRWTVELYGGWVALPRWNMVRGAQLLGFLGDSLTDTRLLETQNRQGQVTGGVRAVFTPSSRVKAGVAFHEQRDNVGVAFRVVSADAVSTPTEWLRFGGRFTADLQALGFSEARVWADVSAVKAVPLSVDYSYQNPALLLPQTSVLAAFGGDAWHELGAEATVYFLSTMRLGARGAGQLYEGQRLGGRGHLRWQWRPDIDGRGLLLAEVQRLLVPPSGYTQLRVGGRWKARSDVTATADAALFVYDAPVRGQTTSLTGIASVEWAVSTRVRLLASATVMRTPYAAFESQGLVRLVVETEPHSAGGTW